MFGEVLMRIPEGIAPITSAYERNFDPWMNVNLVINASDLLGASLAAAMLEPEGTPKEIKRLYRDILINGEYGDRKCIICQDAYTLIERYDDVRIFTPHRDDPASDGIEHQTPALVILDREERVVGIIFGE